jgi:putative heme iron utilization protein
MWRVVSLVVVPSGQVGCASGVGLKAEGQPCPAAAKLRLIGYRNCAALRSQAATAPARVRSAAMSKIAGISEPESELERLIAELSESGQLIFVFGIGWWTAQLTGAATPVFRGPADRRWWHVVLGDDAASWTMDVRVDEITGIRFVREPYPFPSLAGRESLTVQFLGPGGETVLYCYVHDLYDGQQMRPKKLDAWRALRERYGNRDESRVDRGALLAPAA